VQTPPVNLKERIAALQQRNVSPTQHPSTQIASKGIPIASTGALRDKIAKFEKKGGIPVPRGSFGMGALPCPADTQTAKKRGELYGNRIQGLGRPSGPPVSRSGSPLPLNGGDLPGPRKRCISTGGALSRGPIAFRPDDSAPPVPNGAVLHTPRRNSLAVDFGPGRRVVSAGCAELPSEGVAFPSSPPLCPLQLEESDSSTTTPSPSADSPCLPPEAPEPEVGADTVEALEPIQQALDLEGSDVEEKIELNTVEAQSSTVLSDAMLASPLVHTVTLDSQQDAVVDIPVAKESPLDPEVIPQQTPPQLPPALPDPPLEPPSQSPDAVSHNILHPATEQEEEEIEMTKPEPTQPPLVVPDPIAVSPLPSLAAVSQNASSLGTEVEEMGNVSSVGPSPTSPDPPVAVPQPEEESTETVSITDSVSDVQTKALPPSPELKPAAPSQNKSTFRAVVHRKVTETPAAIAPASSLAAPPTPQVVRPRRSPGIPVVDVTPSTSPGELTILLEEAALLELRLTEGDTSENLDAPSAKTPTSATFQPVNPRSVSATTLTEKPLPILDTELRGRLSLSIPAIREPTLESEIPEIPEEDETSDGRSLASTTFSQRSPSHRKYLSGLRRLTGRRSSTNMPGAYPRDSISLSSEDSAMVATPPDSLSGRSGGFGIAWPSVSPKKHGPVGRASSFTDKLFHRSRTRSNVSTTDTGTVCPAMLP